MSFLSLVRIEKPSSNAFAKVNWRKSDWDWTVLWFTTSDLSRISTRWISISFSLFRWQFFTTFVFRFVKLWSEHCVGDNQIKVKLPAFKKNAADLLQVPVGQVSLGALEHNIAVATLFIEAWLRRKRCVCVTNFRSNCQYNQLFFVQNRGRSHSAVLSKTLPRLKYRVRKSGSGFSTGYEKLGQMI